MVVEVRTVGHGTLSADDFSRLVTTAAIRTVVDVRRFPASRRYPHFRAAEMARWLASAGVDYRWLPALGGRRPPQPGSPNRSLRNPQLRGYADHMAGAEFAAGVTELLSLAGGDDRAVAVMCAESVWWRCHRRLLADHLVLVEGCRVEHLLHDGRRQPHVPTAEARRVESTVVYDGGTQPSLFAPGA